MKFGFYVSNKATRIKKAITLLQADQQLKSLLYDIRFVYRDSNVSDSLNDLCMQENIFFLEEDFSKVDKGERSLALSNSLLNLMKKMNVNYLFVFGSRILKGELIEQYKNGIINFHPSLLPAFPGINSIDQAVEYGSFISGNTAHFIDSGIDSGEIIMQNISLLKNELNYDEILDKQLPMLVQIMIWLKEGRMNIQGRKVRVKNAGYDLQSYIPNLEIKISGMKV